MHNHAPKNYNCPACNFVNGNTNTKNAPTDIVYEDHRTMAMISTKFWAGAKVGIVVIPKDHFENIYDIPDSVIGEVAQTVKKVAIALKATLNCDGISTRQHNEPAGNQTTFHFHTQVIPRYKNDDFYQNSKNHTYPNPEERSRRAEQIKSNLEQPSY